MKRSSHPARKTSDDARRPERVQVSRLVCLLVLLTSVDMWAHGHQRPVIVDTDMALDDMRAMAVLLTCRDLDVRAIVTSDGAAAPDVGAETALRLLTFLKREEIPVGAGRILGIGAPPWRWLSSAAADQLPAVAGKTGSGRRACEVLSEAMEGLPSTADYICLGPLSNLAEMLRDVRGVASKISGVYFYGSPPGSEDPDWNVNRDHDAAKAVFASGLTICIFNANDPQSFDARLYAEVGRLHCPGAELISTLHKPPRIQELVRNGHLKLWDDMVALYLRDSSLGSFRPISPGSPIHVLHAWNWDASRERFLAAVGDKPPSL